MIVVAETEFHPGRVKSQDGRFEGRCLPGFIQGPCLTWSRLGTLISVQAVPVSNSFDIFYNILSNALFVINQWDIMLIILRNLYCSNCTCQRSRAGAITQELFYATELPAVTSY